MSFQSDWATAIEELQVLTERLQGVNVGDGEWWIGIHPTLVTGGFLTQSKEVSHNTFTLSHLTSGAAPGDLLDAQLAVAQGLVERARRILADRAVTA